MAANRSVESPLEAEEAGASGDAPMPPPAPLASELTSIAPDPSTTSALTGPSPTSSKQATDSLTEPFSASTMRAAELAEALAAERKQALEREMERADSLARELAQIREEVSALRNRSRHGWTSFPALPLPLLAPVDPAPPAASHEASKIVQPSFQRPESPAQTFAPTAEVHTRPKMPPPADSATATVAQAAPPVPSAAGPPVAIAAPPLPETVRAAPAPALQPHAPAPSGHQRLLDRATALIKAHDISGARLVLERAVSEGSVEATHLLAQTYDPRMLKLWAVVGLPGDAVRADELYARARAAGMRVPPGRIVRN
jgi:hypothetical protein